LVKKELQFMDLSTTMTDHGRNLAEEQESAASGAHSPGFP